MKLFVCLDERNGLLFGGRRQSSDKVVYRKISEIVGDEPLWLHPYSQSLFCDTHTKLRVDADFAAKALENEWCFYEKCDTPLDLKSVKALYVFRWNRHYPSDVRFDVEGICPGLELVRTLEIPGNSHPVITLEVFEK